MVSDLLTILDGRSKDLPPDQFSYKLQGGSFGMDVPMVGNLDIDESTMSMWIPIADGNRRDGVGDLLEVTGINVSRHVKNPIVLFDHGKEVHRPIARARQDPKDINSYTFTIDAVNKTAGCRAYFYQGKNSCGLTGGCEPGTHGQFCEELFDMAVNGFIGAGSIGYQIIAGEHLPPDYVSGLPQGLHLKRVLLLEGSLVVLPANDSTVGKSLGVIDYLGKALTGGKILGKSPSIEFKQAFTKYLPERKALVTSNYNIKDYSARVPNYRKADDPEVSCETCQAYSPHGGQFGECRMFGVKVGPDDVCDRWVSAEKSLKTMNHGPNCKCMKCREQYATKSACGCHECKSGNACPCDKNIGTKAEPTNKPPQPPQPQMPPAPTQSPKPPKATQPVQAQQPRQPVQTAQASEKRKEEAPKQTPKKLDTNQHPQHVVNQYLRAFQDRLENNPAQAEAAIQHSADKIRSIFGPDAADFFTRKARFILENQSQYHQAKKPGKDMDIPGQKIIKHEGDKWVLYSHEGRVLGRHDSKKDALKQEQAIEISKHKMMSPVEYEYTSKSLKELRDKYREAQGKFHRSRKAVPGVIHMTLYATDLDSLREDAGQKGVEVHWMSDDGNGKCKVKLVGMDSTLEDLAKKFGKAVRKMKSLPNQNTKNTNVIGTLDTANEENENPTRSRSRQTIDTGDNLLHGEHSTRNDGRPESTEILTAAGGSKAMKTREMEDNPNPPGSKHRQGDGTNQGGRNGDAIGEYDPNEDYSPGSQEQASMGPEDYQTKDKNPYADEPYGSQVVRRLHADMSGLLHEYDEFLNKLEDDPTRQIVLKQIHHYIDSLEELEDHFANHPRYKEISSKRPLEGVEPEPLVSGMKGMKQLANAGDAATGFSSGMEPSTDEVRETMKRSGEAPDYSPVDEPTPDNTLEGLGISEDPRGQSLTSPQSNEVSPIDAMEGMQTLKPREDEDEELKSLYLNHIKELRKKHGKQYPEMEEKIEEYTQHGKRNKEYGKLEEKEEEYTEHGKREEKAIALRKHLKNLGVSNDTETKKMRKHLINQLMKCETLLQGKEDKEHIPGTEAEEGSEMDITPGKKAIKGKYPSEDISPEKARQILKDKTAHGHKLTPAQEGMFGAAAGRGKD